MIEFLNGNKLLSITGRNSNGIKNSHVIFLLLRLSSSLIPIYPTMQHIMSSCTKVIVAIAGKIIIHIA